MEHSVDLSAKTFAQAVSPSSAQKIIKKVKQALRRETDDNSGTLDLDDLDARLVDISFDDDDDNIDFEARFEGDDGEEDEALEAEFDAADSVGKALLLVKQVRQSWLGLSLWLFTRSYSDPCFSSSSGVFQEVLPAG
jgi:hypothetical protein